MGPEEVVYSGYVDVSNDGCERRRVPDINPGIVPVPAVSSEIMPEGSSAFMLRSCCRLLFHRGEGGREG